MRMKEDHMMNGQIKPGYNVQAATNGQYVLAYDIFPNPTDTRTLKPFLQSIQTLDLFENIVADAGYGSEENYVFIIDELEKTPLIPYGMYQKELTRKYKNSPTNPSNWDYLEETDQFIKPDGVVYSLRITLVELTSTALNMTLKSMRQITYKTQQSWKTLPKQKVAIRDKFITIRLGITLKNSSRKNCIAKKALVSTPNGKSMSNPFLAD